VVEHLKVRVYLLGGGLMVEPACASLTVEGEERRGEELEKNIVYKEISHYICHYAKVRCEAAFPPGQGPAGLA